MSIGLWSLETGRVRPQPSPLKKPGIQAGRIIKATLKRQLRKENSHWFITHKPGEMKMRLRIKGVLAEEISKSVDTSGPTRKKKEEDHREARPVLEEVKVKGFNRLRQLWEGRTSSKQ